MKKLLIILLFLPSVAFAKINYADNVLRDCKNLAKFDEMSQKEINKCFKSTLLRNSGLLRVHEENIDRLFDNDGN